MAAGARALRGEQSGRKSRNRTTRVWQRSISLLSDLPVCRHMARMAAGLALGLAGLAGAISARDQALLDYYEPSLGARSGRQGQYHTHAADRVTADFARTVLLRRALFSEWSAELAEEEPASPLRSAQLLARVDASASSGPCKLSQAVCT
eukprot:3582818-Prymnesium_polylepis.1